MYITTDLKNSIPLCGGSPGSYEWWYYDAFDPENDCGVVIIFYSSNPFSINKIKDLEDDLNAAAKLYPALSISIYKENKAVYYSFKEFAESEFQYDEETNNFTFGDHSFTYQINDQTLTTHLNIIQKLDSDLSLDLSLQFEGSKTSSELINRKAEKDHIWNLLLPVADVNGDIIIDDSGLKEEIKFRGKGYHDHNAGDSPMKESFRDWYWGRYHFEDCTLIYYLMNEKTGSQYEGWLIDKDNGQVITEFTELSDESAAFNIFGLKSSRLISLSSDSHQVTIQTDKVIDDGPFYQRFKGRAILNTGEEVKISEGLSEYIYPSRIYSKLFWPLVHMRLEYVQSKRHWVQGSNFWYKLTW
ncbi:hypothetical protein AB2B38_001005 [Balneola sp. MJW-20]|uniref:hypothetical protein n=1 Tax=Gracilimonas aurantiaca TaxID=3234185 RepID=UPI0034AF185D